MSAWEKIVRRDVPWAELCALEEALVASVQADRRRRYLLVSEPRPVYTAGRHASRSGLKVSEQELFAGGIDCAEAPRGGQWTYHGPGQVLLYPIAALETLGLGSMAVRCFADRFRSAIAGALAAEGLAPELRERPYGIYLDGAKVASFGLKFRRGVVSHGVAVYRTPQREAFRRIDPCGVAGARVTSLEENGSALSWHAAEERLTGAVVGAFGQNAAESGNCPPSIRLSESERV